ncbi:MAG TPA: ribonuclease HII [Candidatus Saccharimonadales bacterium]|nr:ribonuclease HII [Candidatus Saccharimonadales bacterium]
MILGIDEVGRGPWAGPLVIGAVVLGGATIDGLTDSKKLSKKRREELDIIIRSQASGYGLGWVSAAEIDQIGLSASLRLATKRAVEQITAPYHEIVIDGTSNFLKDTSKENYVTTMKKADLLVPSVSAASIIAKVARDTYMTEQDDVYTGYKFKSHVGYGTAVHRAAIELLGVTPLHRLSFAPLVKYQMTGPVDESVPDFRPIADANQSAGPLVATRAQVTTKQIGDAGEDEAANYLVREGHEIIDRNWKTKYCEIDIISHHKGTVYFTEVKYRKKDDQGGGLAAVTAKKQRQMKFAAEYYVLKNNLQNYDLRLAAIDVSGQPPHVRDFLKLG